MLLVLISIFVKEGHVYVIRLLLYKHVECYKFSSKVLYICVDDSSSPTTQAKFLRKINIQVTHMLV